MKIRLLDKATTNENHRRFIRIIIETELVWYLANESGVANSISNDDETAIILLFWSNRAYAKRAKENGYETYSENSMSLFEFLYRWLPGMTSDGVLAGTNWTQDLIGNESEAFNLREEIEKEMPKNLLKQYLKKYKAVISK